MYDPIISVCSKCLHRINSYNALTNTLTHHCKLHDKRVSLGDFCKDFWPESEPPSDTTNPPDPNIIY